MKLLKQNNVILGIVLGILTPIAGYLILWLLNRGAEIWFNDGETILLEDTIRMTSIFLNIFIYIPYLKHARYENTGRGILLVTFIGVVIIFLTMI